jgi:mRNA-degrading endonuclease YafQ of YafQ-DinJ toxin-antitoxin module
MWKVEFESHQAETEAERLINDGSLSLEDRRVITAWIRQVSLQGPDSIRRDKRWADHPLEREWKGYRSSAFSNKGRIIYRIEEKVVKVLIERITVEHDYRRKDEKENENAAGSLCCSNHHGPARKSVAKKF